ncbi:WW domain-containing oxidoreductase [Mytilus galloprovincialis]|uniref:WW domain-containing oxidoreductase n=1 Tax=Mytilus galloprovincialis TaxID=29158 RepID=A0A8B6EEQ6_MYTGA|nr:WW domain-containing oxidoreductase [Mytilus galloprovincialis]
MAMLGASVIIACRSEKRALEAIARMKSDFQREKEQKTEGATQTDDISVEFMKLDLSSLGSTKELTDQFIDSGRQLNTLICNARIAFHPLEYTEDGNETMFQVNYLSQLLLTFHLLPVMKRSGDDSRVILVSSHGHNFHSTPFTVDKIQGKQHNADNFPRFKYYGNSKLYQILQMYFMNRRLADSNVCVVSTSWIGRHRSNTRISRYFMDDLGLENSKSKSPVEGAECTLNAAINPALKGVRDVYYQDCKPKNTHDDARNKDIQESVLEYSLSRLNDFITDDIRNEWKTK